MITDALLHALGAVMRQVLGILPTGAALTLPSLQPVWDAVAQVDVLVPVQPLALTILALLAAGALFLIVRMILTVWNVVKP